MSQLSGVKVRLEKYGRCESFHILSQSLICCIISCCGGICFLWQVSGLISNRADIWGLQIDCQLEISLCTLFQEMFLYFLDSSISSETRIHPEWKGEQCYQIVPPLGFKQHIQGTEN